MQTTKELEQKTTTKNTTKNEKKSETQKTTRDVKEYAIVPVEEQTDYEKRFYMKDYHKNEPPTVVRHKTSHSIKSASEQCLEAMQQIHNANEDITMFKTSDLIALIESYGPSYGDVVRNAMRKLAKQNIIKIHNIANERSRAKYAFELLKFE